MNTITLPKRVLEDMSGHAQMQAEIERLRAENAALKAKAIGMKVTEKGGLSVYGLGRFPVTLYRGQWERLLDAKDDILGFIVDNADRLSVKE
jgi:hypothetical protein